ncbi:MAG: hypothetical protein HQL18_03970 [Candidatus Omnitrophica bacterium]|nr:hypothetical protein [Candidatus Omnitrophota bacterium]
MRQLAFLFLVVMCAVTSAHAMGQAEARALFAQSVQVYKEGQFDKAAALDEKILQGGFESPAVYYNLGNALFKDKKLGKAIVNYLRAEALAPRDADLKANLAFARDIVENYQPELPSTGIVRLLTIKRMSTGELKWLSLSLFMAIGTFFAVGLYGAMRPKRIVQVTVLLATVWLYFTAACVLKAATESSRAVAVRAESARFEPSVSATSYFKLSEGTEVRLLRTQDSWAKIERTDGRSAWVPVNSLEKVFP